MLSSNQNFSPGQENGPTESEERLRQSEQRFRLLFERASDAIFLLDTRLCFLEANRCACELLGYMREELLGLSVLDMLRPADIPDTNALVEQIRQGEVGYAERWMQRKDGTSILLEGNGSLLDDGSFLIVARDITARKRMEEALRESEERIRLIADNAPAYISNVDTQYRYRFVNRANAERFGLTPEEMVGKSVREVMGQKAFEIILPYMNRAFQGETVAYEATVPYERLGERYMEVFYAPDVAEDGTITGLVGIIHDVTERKKVEQDRDRFAAEVAVLNEQLRRAMTETHHRVKNNLQVIAAMIDLQILSRREMLPLSEFQRLSRHIRALAAIHDLLTEAAGRDSGAEFLEAGAVLEKLFPLLQTIVGADRRLRYQVEEARLTSRQGASLALVANELVSNAIKHGANEVEIRLTADGEKARLEVADNGPGFPADFDPKRAAHTGLELVNTLSAWDLQGEASYGNRPQGGARVIVTMKIPPAMERS